MPRLVGLATILSFAVSANAARADEVTPPKVGEAFPLLEFPVLGEDELATLADYRGTKVLLIQFASW